jgi:hypothetical protein
VKGIQMSNNNVIYLNFNTRAVLDKSQYIPIEQKELPLDVFEEFDLMINKIKARFGENQPKDGVMVKKAIFKFKNKETLETYGRGCIHNSMHNHEIKSMFSKKGMWNAPMPFPVDLRLINKVLEVNSGGTLEVGRAADPFMWMDQKYKNTLNTIHLANKNNVKLVFNTMSDLCATDEYINLLIEGKHKIKMSMGFKIENADEIERKISPGAPSVLRRKKAFNKLKDAGVDVEECYILIEELKNYPKKEFERSTGISLEYFWKNVKPLYTEEDKKTFEFKLHWNCGSKTKFETPAYSEKDAYGKAVSFTANDATIELINIK